RDLHSFPTRRSSDLLEGVPVRLAHDGEEESDRELVERFVEAVGHAVDEEHRWPLHEQRIEQSLLHEANDAGPVQVAVLADQGEVVVNRGDFRIRVGRKTVRNAQRVAAFATSADAGAPAHRIPYRLRPLDAGW